MSIPDICALSVQDLAADDCVLLMWCTDPMLEKGFDVIRSWGFKYKTVGFVWAKCKQEDAPPFSDDFPIGTGYWTRANPEYCLLATRGHPHRINADVRELVISPRREHSRKPDEMYGYIERLCSGPYVELFARYPRSGWDTAFSTLEGSVERRWKSNEGKPSQNEEPIDILSQL